MISFSQISSIGVVCAFYIVITGSSSIAAEVKNKTTEIHISRKHLSVWFDYSVRYYDHEADNAYSKDDLTVMVNVVSRRFSKLAIDVAPIVDKLPPENGSHSRIWVPEVVAEHNKARNSSTSSPPMEVIVSFDVARIARTSEVTSFDVAKYMADKANEIYPGTVKTLMLYNGFSVFSSYFNVKENIQQLKVAREKINGNSSSSSSPEVKYDLAIFLDLKDCGHFKGNLGSKAKELAPHVEIIVTLLRPNYHQMSFTPEILHKMFVAKFEDCERKLKDEKPGIRVIPSILWMARKGSVSKMAQCWQLMSDWGKKNDNEVIMYEAFDTPHGRLLSDQGWWRLKDRSEHDIKEDSFMEKIEGKGGDSSSNLFPSWDDSNEEDSSSRHKTGGSSSSSSSHVLAGAREPARPESHQALYIALVLLSVICTLLVAVIVGLVLALRSIVLLPPSRVISGTSTTTNDNSVFNGAITSDVIPRRSSRHQNRRSALQHQSSFQGEEEQEEGTNGGIINGSVLEIRDTTPIVAVTYKK